MRALRVWDAGEMDAESAFLRDHRMMALAAEGRVATLTAWRRAQASVSFGRFHRLPVPAPLACERRIGGGRAIALGPGVLGITLVTPSVDWLDPDAAPLRPDQVLNRALRPLLAYLRENVGDAFYPGRDLVTLDRRPVAHASFTVAPDGVCVVEIHLAVSSGFAMLGDLLSTADPTGVAAVDATAFSDASCLAALGRLAQPANGVAVDTGAWLNALTPSVVEAFACEVGRDNAESVPVEPCAAGRRRAYHRFLCERGPVPEGAVSVATASMLGAVEVSAVLRAGRIHDLMISGDVIAPFHTLEAISVACEGQPGTGPVTRRRLARVLSQPRSFLLGCNDLDALLARLCGG